MPLQCVQRCVALLFSIASKEKQRQTWKISGSFLEVLWKHFRGPFGSFLGGETLDTLAATCWPEFRLHFKCFVSLLIFAGSCLDAFMVFGFVLETSWKLFGLRNSGEIGGHLLARVSAPF